MQRVLRDENGGLSNPQALLHCQALIHRHCPPSIGNLFAVPREGRQGGLEWWTELPGQPRRFAELSHTERTALLARLTRRLEALGQLVETLARSGEPAADELRPLLAPPAETSLYDVGGEPLIVRWAGPNPVSAKPPASSKPTPSPRTPRTAPSATASPIARAPSSRRFWLWMLPLLAGLALLGLWLGLGYPTKDALDRQQQVAPEPLPFACHDSDEVQPPEFVTIFDTSGSMNLHIGATQEDEQWYFGMPDILRTIRANDQRIVRLHAKPSRLDVAQEAFASLVEHIDPAIDIGLITYRGCEAPPVVQGRFPAERRAQLVTGIRRLQADDGTPLAASLLRAAAMVDGRDRDAVILAFVDGADGCGYDQCAVARQIAQRQPRLRVNVVDISASGLSDCIAEQTGGRVFGSQDAATIADMLQDAGREALSAAHCPG